MNKAILIVGAVWLAVLTYLTLTPKSLAESSGAPVVAYVHGDSLQKT